MDKHTFEDMAKVYPEIEPIRALRESLGKLNLGHLPIGPDGRNRTILSPFGTITSRNQPRTSEFVLTLPKWLRCIVRPRPGYSLANIDYSQQEFGVAGALSGDENMMAAYRSGDPYLAFGKQVGSIPPEGTKETHEKLREVFKQCVLGVQYSMGSATLAFKIKQPQAYAQELLEFHRKAYPQYWAWLDDYAEYAHLHSRVDTAYGWNLHVTGNTKYTTIRNFPMQANGSEVFRLACCLATERGVTVCAPNQDALLIEAPTSDIQDAIGVAEKAMWEASQIALDGFELSTETKIFHYPKRYRDDKAAGMWDEVWNIIAGLSPELARIAEECR